ncbi:MAG: creatininase family protein [Synergistaceae bacterium]|jgi:creatinine amidohydrolase|nr:creatininase family protein [Synergistaceae bacterium]
MEKVRVEEMTSAEFRDVLNVCDMILIPIGSIEEHGTHGKFLFDTVIAHECAYRLGCLTHTPVAPTIPIGQCRNLMGFPGGASLDTELVADLLLEVAEGYVSDGVRRILFVNSHGGNGFAVKMACGELWERYGVLATQAEWYDVIAEHSRYTRNDHGGEYGTSVVMALDESQVDLSQAKTVPLKNPSENLLRGDYLTYRGVNVSLPLPMDYYTPAGDLGPEAANATVRQGREMVDIYIENTVKIIEEMKKILL